jgi:hypothetical protein
MYILFFKKGKYVTIKNLKESGNLLLIFLALFCLIVPLLFSINIINFILFNNPPPGELITSFGYGIIALIIYTFFPYIIQREINKSKKEFYLGNWLNFIFFIEILVLIFSLINTIYTLFFVSKEISSSLGSISIFMSMSILINYFYLKSISFITFGKNKKFRFKNKIKISIFVLILSILFCIIYWK